VNVTTKLTIEAKTRDVPEIYFGEKMTKKFTVTNADPVNIICEHHGPGEAFTIDFNFSQYSRNMIFCPQCFAEAIEKWCKPFEILEEKSCPLTPSKQSSSSS